MHILIIPSEEYLQPGNSLPGIFQHDQAHALKRQGCQIGVISPGARKLGTIRNYWKQWRTGIEAISDDGIPTYKRSRWVLWPKSYQATVWFWIQAGLELYQHYVAQQGQPDLIHAHNVLNAGLLAQQIFKLYGTPYVITEHSSQFILGKIPDSLITSIKTAYCSAKTVITVSPNLGKLLSARFGESMQDWQWIPNVLNKVFETSQPLNSKREGHFSFLNVAALVENKAHKLLLTAFARQFSGNLEVQLRIGGDGPLKTYLKGLVKDLGIEQQVLFLGYLDRKQIFSEMQSCDAFVLSSNFETFGVVLIEALACGKPVIATACGGPECIVTSGNGFLVPPQNVAALGASMIRMLEKINNYDPLILKKDCIDCFGEKTIANRLIEVYQSCV